MKIEQFSIVYDNPMAIYYGGQTVSGNIILKIAEKELKCDGIFLHCIGRATVHFTERYTVMVNGVSQTTTVHHRAVEPYFDTKIPLANAGDLKVIPVGLHTFPFTVALPSNLPTSFEGAFGHIRYICKCNIARPWRFDPRTNAPFSVLSIADLNRIPNAGDPLTVERTKTVGMLFFKTGTITVNFTINKSAFVPGEYVFINAKVANETKKIVARSSVCLYSVTSFYAAGRRRTIIKYLLKMSRGKIPPKSVDEWMNEPLRLPSLPPSDLGGCNIIRTNYFLKFTADPTGFLAFDLDVELPLTIGTIPLTSDFMVIEPSPLQIPSNTDYSFNSDASTTAPPPYETPFMQAYPSIPPPSYEESTYGRSKITEEDDGEGLQGRQEFAPRYAFYQYNQTPANQARTSEFVKCESEVIEGDEKRSRKTKK